MFLREKLIFAWPKNVPSPKRFLTSFPGSDSDLVHIPSLIRICLLWAVGYLPRERSGHQVIYYSQ